MMPRIGMGGMRGNDRNGGMGMIVMGVLVSIGIAKTFYSMYTYVKKGEGVHSGNSPYFDVSQIHP
jgi:hypothetical protein